MRCALLRSSLPLENFRRDNGTFSLSISPSSFFLVWFSFSPFPTPLFSFLKRKKEKNLSLIQYETILVDFGFVTFFLKADFFLCVTRPLLMHIGIFFPSFRDL